MLLKLALLLSAICAISPKIVEIECYFDVRNCVADFLVDVLPANATWKFLCPENCTSIHFDNIVFPRFPREIWITHPQVTYLYINGTDFEEIAYGDFFNAGKLTELVLRDQFRSMSLRDNCFWGAFELISIKLPSNNIREVESDAFNGIPHLTLLDMQKNNITHISNELFRNLPKLENLYLYYNAIETIESQAFLHNPNLDHININWNNLTEVDLLLPFNNIGSITILGNKITKVAYRSTSHEIEQSDKGAYLYLEQNELSELYIQPNFFVETLTLLENKIERIDRLPALRSLKMLNLRKCEIKSLDGQRFVEKYVNLEILHLTGNNLTSFSKETFAGLNSLKTLWLDANELKEVEFPRLESLITLDLKNNSLTEFPYGKDVRDTFPALTTLDIRNNDFVEKYLVELVGSLQDQGIKVSYGNVPFVDFCDLEEC